MTLHLASGAALDVRGLDGAGGADVKQQLAKLQGALEDLSAGQQAIEDALRMPEHRARTQPSAAKPAEDRAMPEPAGSDNGHRMQRSSLYGTMHYSSF